MASLSSRRDKALKVFSDLETDRFLVSSLLAEVQEFDRYFCDLQAALTRKYSELSQREKAFHTKAAEARASLQTREQAILREHASLARVQAQKDYVLAASLNKSGSDFKAKKAAPVANSANGPTSLVAAIEQATNAYAEPIGPKLRLLCKNMDAEGLKKFVLLRRKESDALRRQLPTALRGAVNPSGLVLKTLEDERFDGNPDAVKGGKAIRRACILLLESLSEVFADPILGEEYPVVPSQSKQLAKVVAKRWRSKVNVTKEDYSLETHVFLQLLATFGIASEFSADDLCAFVNAIARRAKAPSLCRSLGLTHKIPGLIEKLISEGKQIEALTFAHTFEMIDRVKPVVLLDSYLEDGRKAAEALAERAPNEFAGQNDATVKELSTLEAIIRVVDEFDLGSVYPTEHLHNRMAQLEIEREDRRLAALDRAEKKRVEKKRGAPASLQHATKRPLVGEGSGLLGSGHSPGGIGAGNIGAGGGVGPDSSSLAKAASASAVDRGDYVLTDLGQSMFSSYDVTRQPEATYDSAFGLSNRDSPSLMTSSQSGYERRPESTYAPAYSLGSRNLASLLTSSGYEQRPEAGYGSAYGLDNRDATSLLPSLRYPATDVIGSSMLGSTSAYPDLSETHTSYWLGSGLQTSSSGYLSSYRR